MLNSVTFQMVAVAAAVDVGETVCYLLSANVVAYSIFVALQKNNEQTRVTICGATLPLEVIYSQCCTQCQRKA